MFKLIKNIVRLTTLVVVLNISLANAIKPNIHYVHGTACQPVSLTQAINFKMTWTKDGVFNPNSLGSGKFFFVACPITYTDDFTPVAASGGRAFVNLYYQDRTADLSTRTFCFAQRQKTKFPSGNLPISVKTVNSTDTNAGTGPISTFLSLGAVYQQAAANYSQLDQFVVVCKIYPQAGIGGVLYRHD